MSSLNFRRCSDTPRGPKSLSCLWFRRGVWYGIRDRNCGIAVHMGTRYACPGGGAIDDLWRRPRSRCVLLERRCDAFRDSRPAQHRRPTSAVVFIHGSGRNSRESLRFSQIPLRHESPASCTQERRGGSTANSRIITSSFVSLADDANADNSLAERPGYRLRTYWVWGFQPGGWLGPRPLLVRMEAHLSSASGGRGHGEKSEAMPFPT